ncbi:MAG: hypothetical protein WDZ27_02885 [Waddliaceae bacterium]
MVADALRLPPLNEGVEEEIPLHERIFDTSRSVFNEFQIITKSFAIDQFFFDDHGNEKENVTFTFNASVLKDFNPIKRYLFDPEFRLNTKINLSRYFEYNHTWNPSFEHLRSIVKEKNHSIELSLSPYALLEVAERQQVKSRHEMKVVPKVVKVAAGSALISYVGYMNSQEEMSSLLGIICSLSGLIACSVGVTSGGRKLNEQHLETTLEKIRGFIACKKLFEQNIFSFQKLDEFKRIISHSQNQDLIDRALQARTPFQRFKWTILAASSVESHHLSIDLKL